MNQHGVHSRQNGIFERYDASFDPNPIKSDPFDIGTTGTGNLFKTKHYIVDKSLIIRFTQVPISLSGSVSVSQADKEASSKYYLYTHGATSSERFCGDLVFSIQIPAKASQSNVVMILTLHTVAASRIECSNISDQYAFCIEVSPQYFIPVSQDIQNNPGYCRFRISVTENQPSSSTSMNSFQFLTMPS